MEYSYEKWNNCCYLTQFPRNPSIEIDMNIILKIDIEFCLNFVFRNILRIS